jgi:hypothetical protein
MAQTQTQPGQKENKRRKMGNYKFHLTKRSTSHSGFSRSQGVYTFRETNKL